jgi:hypothetical protein
LGIQRRKLLAEFITTVARFQETGQSIVIKKNQWPINAIKSPCNQSFAVFPILEGLFEETNGPDSRMNLRNRDPPNPAGDDGYGRPVIPSFSGIDTIGTPGCIERCATNCAGRIHLLF